MQILSQSATIISTFAGYIIGEVQEWKQIIRPLIDRQTKTDRQTLSCGRRPNIISKYKPRQLLFILVFFGQPLHVITTLSVHAFLQVLYFQVMDLLDPSQLFLVVVFNNLLQGVMHWFMISLVDLHLRFELITTELNKNLSLCAFQVLMLKYRKK